MNEKETKKLASLVNKVARAKAVTTTYNKSVDFRDTDLEFIKGHAEEFMDAIGSDSRIKGRIENRESVIHEIENDWFDGFMWFTTE